MRVAGWAEEGAALPAFADLGGWYSDDPDVSFYLLDRGLGMWVRGGCACTAAVRCDLPCSARDWRLIFQGHVYTMHYASSSSRILTQPFRESCLNDPGSCCLLPRYPTVALSLSISSVLAFEKITTPHSFFIYHVLFKS